MVRQFTWKTLEPIAWKPPVGKKQLFLPNINIVLLRSSSLPPRMAKFRVPLSFNKLDMKDYLYHAYNVPVLSVRSFIILQRLIEGTHDRYVPRQWRRPKSIKHMIVEMKDPFVWPEEETDLSGWDNQMFEESEKEQQKLNQRQQLGGIAEREDGSLLREQAKDLLEGKTTWKPTWMTYGKAKAGVQSTSSST